MSRCGWASALPPSWGTADTWAGHQEHRSGTASSQWAPSGCHSTPVGTGGTRVNPAAQDEHPPRPPPSPSPFSLPLHPNKQQTQGRTKATDRELKLFLAIFPVFTCMLTADQCVLAFNYKLSVKMGCSSCQAPAWLQAGGGQSPHHQQLCGADICLLMSCLLLTHEDSEK